MLVFRQGAKVWFCSIIICFSFEKKKKKSLVRMGIGVWGMGYGVCGWAITEVSNIFKKVFKALLRLFPFQ